MSKSIAKVSELTKRYSGNTEYSLRGVNLEIEEGDFFGLLGPNGCGKTTLISSMTGLITPTAGDVFINNKNIKKDLTAIKPITGLIPQEIALYPTLSIVENLRFFGRLYGLHGKLLKERVKECLAIGKLESVANRAVSKYSGGMQRRANLIVGLIHHPKIIYLDEPTVNVDPQSRHVIFEILKKLNQQGTTMIYTTHYLEEAQEMCNKVAVMNQGKVIAKDTPERLIANSPSAKDLGDVFLELTGYQLRD